MTGVRTPVTLLVVVLLACSACAVLPVSAPRDAYYPAPSALTRVLAHTLYRAAQAAGDDPARYSFALIQTPRVVAVSAPDAVFYFSDGLATQSPPHVDALVAQTVAHQVLGHAGKRRALSLGMTVWFTALGFVIPGLNFADLVVNPLVVKAFTREQQLIADRRAVEMLSTMGHPRPKRTLAGALTAAAAVNGPAQGGLLASEPDLSDRLAELEPLESVKIAATASVPSRR